MPMKWRFAWALVLALVASPAFALGLGQIQVRSGYGEPFLAEIPIVSSDPAELRRLEARLASPETFARIGLQPPEGLVRNLQFNVALDASGRPVIRVTSAEPVDQPLVTFLIEADWGQGRLVREYSALLDAPDTIAAPAQPPIQAPVPDQGDRIVRPAATAPEPADASLPEPAAAEADAVAIEPSEPAEAADEETPRVAETEGQAPEPAIPAAPVPPAPQPAPAAAAVPGQYGPVQAGDTLSGIVQRMSRDAGVSANQMMLALLRTNPQAFIGGNVNLVREGAVLRMPDQEQVRQLSASEANAEVRAQVARWREMSAPRAQPMDTATAQDGQEQEAATPDAASAPAPAATADARLEIAPPGSADGQQAGIRSGITAGGEGEMLRQELQETRETLAARDAEVEELKARLTELEQLQGQQQQLITLKDSELAAAQQRLAESNQEPAPTLAQANQAQDGGPTPQEAGSGTPWIWIGLGLVLVIAAILAWARSRRNAPAPARSGPAPRTAAPAWHAGGGASAAQADARQVPEASVAPAPASPAAPVPEPVDTVAPAADPEPEFVESTSEQPDPEAPAALTGAGERLELAKAYIELGDVDTARELLNEVAASGVAPESDEAARLLQTLA